MPRKLITALAAALVGLEGAVLLVLAGAELLGILQGQSAELPTAIALVVLTVLLGAGAVACAVGLLRGATWARSGAIVAQVLVFAVGVAAPTVISDEPWVMIVLVAVAVVTGALVLLVSRPDSADAG